MSSPKSTHDHTEKLQMERMREVWSPEWMAKNKGMMPDSNLAEFLRRRNREGNSTTYLCKYVPPRKPQPTKHLPGTWGKIAELERRYLAGEELHVEDDA